MLVAKYIFWLSLFTLVYTYFGYPLLLWILSRIFHRPVKKGPITPRVSFVVVVHNGQDYIERKLANISNLDYPSHNLEIIIGSDGSTDKTNEIVKEYTQKNVKLYAFHRRRGKVTVLNKIIPKAKGDIVVFSDVRQEFEKKALRELVSNFADPNVGSVSGELMLTGQDNNCVSRGVGVYWRYEKFMRRMESRLHSMVGATGAIYAIRKELFVKPPQDTILDDVFIPLEIVKKGYRAVFEPMARAYDRVVSKARDEFRRKTRTHAGNFQVFLQCRHAFNPLQGIIAWEIFSHKFLRVIAFNFLLALLISSWYLRREPLYGFFLLMQAAFYVLAGFGWLKEHLGMKNKLSSVPYMFCVLNLAALHGFVRFLLKKQKVVW